MHVLRITKKGRIRWWALYKNRSNLIDIDQSRWLVVPDRRYELSDHYLSIIWIFDASKNCHIIQTSQDAMIFIHCRRRVTKNAVDIAEYKVTTLGISINYGAKVPVESITGMSDCTISEFFRIDICVQYPIVFPPRLPLNSQKSPSVMYRIQN